MDFIEKYYKETDPEIRHTILKEAKENGQGLEEYELREKLWTRRYAKREKEQAGVDYFIRSYVVTQSYSGGLGAFFRSGAGAIGKKILHDLFLDDVDGYGEEGRRVLYDEFCHCATLYYSLCDEDKSYGTKLLGIKVMAQTEVKDKIFKEIKAIKEKALPNLNLEKEMELFARALFDVYARRYQSV